MVGTNPIPGDHQPCIAYITSAVTQISNCKVYCIPNVTLNKGLTDKPSILKYKYIAKITILTTLTNQNEPFHNKLNKPYDLCKYKYK